MTPPTSDSPPNLDAAKAAYYEALSTARVPVDVADQPWDPELVKFLVIAVLIFGVGIVILMTLLFWRGKHTAHVLPSFGVPLIIVAAIVLVIAGYGERQIAPVIGLLGTVAGYLLGREKTPPDRTGRPGPRPRVSDSVSEEGER